LPPVAAFFCSIYPGGSCANRVTDIFGTVGGGAGNLAGGGGPFATVGGGLGNSARGGNYTTVAGGNYNLASNEGATVGGGIGNTANGGGSTVAGGEYNTANGTYSTVAGGAANTAVALSFAAGYRAKATTPGSFVWADHQEFDFAPAPDGNFFGVRATGGVGFTVGIDPVSGAATEFCNLLPAATPSWACTSDRNVKENFVPVDGRDVLRRLVAMPLFSWNMKNGDPAIRSLGPTAQDFYAAFGLGKNDKTIASLNIEGVALGAVQGLYAELKERDAIIAEQQREFANQQRQLEDERHEIAELRERVTQLESLPGELAVLRNAIADLTTTVAVQTDITAH
jgi:hypothetical protein